VLIGLCGLVGLSQGNVKSLSLSDTALIMVWSPQFIFHDFITSWHLNHVLQIFVCMSDVKKTRDHLWSTHRL
jgi:hypothetical protein